ncbi:hypothetical protein [Streptomyces malaysiensis]|uniref:Uncharacterized protein n=1 Tax=Streptomyces malaysiensis subsp. samsunensis TaxID=459658 RepID=A0A9X2LZF8_STRMQ|nr:hypothetical protein [Streptomyces samsunensis]MCQ8832075.1 hypothetical protein [Streptomyces samsunensis]
MTETMDAWEFRTRLALAERSVGKDVGDTVLAEVAAHCAESGERPEDAFGLPEDFAETVASERLPAGTPAGNDPDALTTADYVFTVTGVLGWMTFVVGAYLFVAKGLVIDLTAATLVGCTVVATAVATLHGVQVTLHAGSRARAAGCGLATLVAVILAAVAFVEGPDTVIAHVPTPAICAVGLLLPAWALLYNPPTAPTHEELPSEAWLRKLPQLLEGRHALPRARAAELTREASRHVTEAGCEPEEEFGPVTTYARQLAEAEAPRQHWWLRNDVRSAVSTVFLGAFLVNNLYSHGPIWLTVVAALGTYAAAALLTGHLRRRIKRIRRAA